MMNLKLIIYLLAHLTTTTSSLILRLSCKQYANFNIFEENKALNGSLIRSINGTTQYDCQYQCLMEFHCKSINYERSGKQMCELNGKTPQDIRDGVKLSKRSGWVFLTTNYSEALMGENCRNLNPCKAGVLCKDTCVCPGYECYECKDGKIGIHCEAWKDCKTASSSDKRSGIFVLQPQPTLRFRGFCRNVENTAWLVMQRKTSHIKLSNTWEEYKHGFGDLNGDYWLGLEKLHQITTLATTALSISYRVRSDSKLVVAEYESFKVSSEATGYALTLGAMVRGERNELGFHNNMKFSTHDRDNDVDVISCAKKYGGGWWYRGGSGTSCNAIDFNGNLNKKVLESTLMMIKF